MVKSRESGCLSPSELVGGFSLNYRPVTLKLSASSFSQAGRGALADGFEVTHFIRATPGTRNRGLSSLCARKSQGCYHYLLGQQLHSGKDGVNSTTLSLLRTKQLLRSSVGACTVCLRCQDSGQSPFGRLLTVIAFPSKLEGECFAPARCEEITFQSFSVVASWPSPRQNYPTLLIQWDNLMSLFVMPIA